MTDNPTQPTEPRWILAAEWLVLLLIVALATFLRFWRIEEVPPGFNSDEAVGAVGALTTLREGLKYSYEGQGGGGALGFYFAAASFFLFGPSIAAIRGVAAWAGVMSIFFNYWAIREVFRLEGLTRARWLAGLSSLGLAVSVWHIWPSRVAFATIGVPFLMLPSVYFLWRGLNHPRQRWTFYLSGIFLGGLMYIYLSGAFVPPLYAVFFISQWLVVLLAKKLNWPAKPPQAYMTSQFANLFATAITAIILLLPMAFVLLTSPDIDPNSTRISQAIFTNPQINGGDPWGLLWRATVGNFGAYGVSFSWLWGQPPRLVYMPPAIGAMVFVGFLLAVWRGLRGSAPFLFLALWYPVLLLPSILSPDSIPHNLRTIGATTPAYVYAAITVVSAIELLLAAGRRWVAPKMTAAGYNWLLKGAGLLLGLLLMWQFWQVNKPLLNYYFFVFPKINDTIAAFHVYAVELAEEINREEFPGTAFVLPRDTAAGDINPNFTVDFLTAVAQADAEHYWVVDDERTMADDLTRIAADHRVIRVIQWRTSKHTDADPKGVFDYYLEKYSYYDHKHDYENYTIHTYRLETTAPDFTAGETLQPAAVNFGDQLKLTGFALGDAFNVETVDQPQARSNGLLWLRLGWEKIAQATDNLKVAALIYNQDGQLVTQMDKLLLNNIYHAGSAAWPVGEQTDAYFIIPIPPATPPGTYTLQLAVYGENSQMRLPVAGSADNTATLTDFAITRQDKRAKLEHLSLALPVNQPLLPGITLAGFETLPGASVRSGQQVGASLIWQTDDPPPSEDVAMHLVVKAKENDTEWPISQPAPLAGPGYPSSQWQPGELLRGWLSARIPPAIAPGLYELELSLTQADDPARELLRLPVGDFTITGWPRNFDAPQPQLTVNANFANLATLVGIDAAASTLAPGDTLNAVLHWRSDAEFSQDYTAFVQLIGPDGQLYGQQDQQPGGGQFPTSGWLPGEYIADSYTVPLAADAPPGAYQLAIGLYDAATGQRLPVSGGNCQPDVCLLPGLTVQ